MGILSKIFTWWDGATIGTLLFSARNGHKVGEDDAGNVYYQSKDGAKRWVIYNGANDASRIPPEWHGWMHGTHDGDPESFLPPERKWEATPTPNLTGTANSYSPAGALNKGGSRANATGDYESWTPDS